MGVFLVKVCFMLRTDTIQITPEILSLIAGIDEFKGAWRALGALAPDRLAALRRVATIESIGSSTRIEGSKLSDREVEQLLSNPGERYEGPFYIVQPFDAEPDFRVVSVNYDLNELLEKSVRPETMLCD